MLGHPSRDEREAYLLADVASAHDAGLGTSAILSGPTTASLPGSLDAATVGGLSLAEGLHRLGLTLPPHELLMLQTAEVSGNLSRVLRALADQRTHRAALLREVRRRLAYPVFLVAFGCFAATIASRVTGSSIFVPGAIVVGLFGGIALVVRAALHAAHRDAGPKIPGVSRLVLDAGELPYLQSMHGLYTAGVKLAEAHALALKTSPVEGTRMRLFVAGQHLHEGAPFAESLRRAGALHPETLQMLAAAEASGDLEGALERASRRRRESFELTTRRVASAAIAVIVLTVYGYVAWVVFSFYLSYYGQLLGR